MNKAEKIKKSFEVSLQWIFSKPEQHDHAYQDFLIFHSVTMRINSKWVKRKKIKKKSCEVSLLWIFFKAWETWPWVKVFSNIPFSHIPSAAIHLLSVIDDEKFRLSQVLRVRDIWSGNLSRFTPKVIINMIHIRISTASIHSYSIRDNSTFWLYKVFRVRDIVKCKFIKIQIWRVYYHIHIRIFTATIYSFTVLYGTFFTTPCAVIYSYIVIGGSAQLLFYLQSGTCCQPTTLPFQIHLT